MSKRKRKPKRRKRKRLPHQLNRDDVARVIHEDEHGRVVELSPVMNEIIEEQLEHFREKFGREPGPTDPIFFDPNSDEPRPISEESLMGAMADAAYEAGIDEARIYAIKKTGMIIVAGLNDHMFSQTDKDEWQAAIEEFETMN